MESTKTPVFDFSHFRGDLFGGITAGIVALPLALAFGLSSGLGPEAGLYGAIMIGFFAALFGGTPTQISGPTAPMTAVSMIVIAGIIQANEGQVDKALPAILSVFLLAGLFQILMGFGGIGKYIKYMPYPVVSGFMTAIGLIILITQILPVLGYYPKEDVELINQFKPQAEEVLLDKILKEEAGEEILVLEDFEETIRRAKTITEADIHQESVVLASKHSSGVIGTLRVMGRALKNIQYIELILALLTILIIYGFKRITTRIPSTLVALLAVSIGAFLMQNMGIIDYRPIPRIPNGIPAPYLGIFTNFDFQSISPYILTAITLAFLGAIDSLLTSVVADNMTKTKHSPNKELIGQGIGNSIAAVFGGIPGAGATIRTVVNINSGGKTRLSGMIASLLLLVILLSLSDIASQIPAAVLAGILVTVGIGVMDYKGLRAIPKTPKTDVFVMVVVLLLSVFWNLVYAVGVGLVLASVIFMKKMGDLASDKSRVSTLQDLEEEESYEDERNIPKEIKSKLFIKHLEGPLFFGYTSEFNDMANKIPQSATDVIIRMDHVPYIDQSGLYALEDVILELESKDINVHLIGLNEQPRARMERIDIIPDLVERENIYDKFDDAIKFISERSHVKA